MRRPKKPRTLTARGRPSPSVSSCTSNSGRGGSKAALVANHEFDAVCVGGFHHVVAVGHGDGHCLFAEDMASRRRGVHRDIAMGGVGGHDGNGVAVTLVQKRPMVRPVRDAEIVAEAPGLAAVGVGHPDQIDLGLPIDQLAGIRAEAASTYERNPNAGGPGGYCRSQPDSRHFETSAPRVRNRSIRCRV